MTVKIEEKFNFLPLRLKFLYEIDESTKFWVKKVSNRVETSINISSAKTGSIVSYDDSIRIDHGDNIEIQVRQQFVSY